MDAGALLAEQHDEWLVQRRYLSVESMALALTEVLAPIEVAETRDPRCCVTPPTRPTRFLRDVPGECPANRCSRGWMTFKLGAEAALNPVHCGGADQLKAQIAPIQTELRQLPEQASPKKGTQSLAPTVRRQPAQGLARALDVRHRAGCRADQFPMLCSSAGGEPRWKRPAEVPLTTSLLDGLINPIRASIKPRAYGLKNRKRTNRMLMQMHANRQDGHNA